MRGERLDARQLKGLGRKPVADFKSARVRNLRVIHNDKYKKIGGHMWWLTPAIPALQEAKVGRSLEVRSSRPAWPTW